MGGWTIPVPFLLVIRGAFPIPASQPEPSDAPLSFSGCAKPSRDGRRFLSRRRSRSRKAHRFPRGVGVTVAFWQYGVVKQARKIAWRIYAATRAADDTAPVTGSTAYGVRMIERWNDRTYVYCRGGIYGRFLADYITRRSRPFTFVDIGANQGLYSLVAARNPLCSGVIAFEPVAATHAMLLANIAQNAAEGRITAHALAISSQGGALSIHIPQGHSGMATLADMGTLKGSVRLERIEAVTARVLDVLLAGDSPLIVKVDVEGHEAVVFEQVLATTASSRIEAVFYEIDRRWSDASGIEAMLRGAGFARFRHVGFGRHFDVLAERG